MNIVTRRVKNGAGKSRGFGFLRVPKNKVDAALSLNKTTLAEREVGVVVAQERSEEEKSAARAAREAKRKEIKEKRAADKASTSQSSQPAAKPAKVKEQAERKVPDNSTQLYVNNLLFDATESDLSSFFESKIGSKLTAIEIVKSKFGHFKGRSRGFAFVSVPNDKVEAAKALDKTLFKEREIGVVIARERTEKSENENKTRKPSNRKPRAENENGADAGTANGDSAAKRRPRRPRQNRPRQSKGENAATAQ